jgi:WD40 repeat protein/tRNA A-37 threonylcarbamoyl transferase component Bud32
MAAPTPDELPRTVDVPVVPSQADEAAPPPLADDPYATRATVPPPGSQPAAELLGWPTVPGYEVLGELGRGGMGVVYKARQAKLNRVVALKMILAGAHAGEAELARFRTEAEAIARLQHPHIVQIHEVGEHNGLPFFSLEFCAGGSLEKKLAGTPLPPRDAAALVERLAQAMHAAHAKGVVHRDLKPANVLLTEDGIPKITDFGLAKLEQVGQTATGAIMGTPSYMAPEQAGGKTAQIGPAADVYALGALLYELLTGRPPFRGPTTFDTLVQVLHDEPVPPRQLQPTTPRDLETVCLKCLQKDPVRRYVTAEMLAEDLRRFQGHEPILARPVGAVERAVRWAWRRPAAAALLVVSGVSLLALVGLVVGLVNNTQLREEMDRTESALNEVKEARNAEASARTEAEEQRRKAEAALGVAEAANKEADRIGYFHSVFLADMALKENNVPQARQRLEECKPEQRKWEWRYLNARGQSELFAVPGVQAVFSPDGARIATADHDGVVRMFDARTGAQAFPPLKGAQRLSTPLFSPDGTRLAARTLDGRWRVFDARTGAEVFAPLQGPAQLHLLVFSPDGTRIAATCGDNTVRFYNARTGAEIPSLHWPQIGINPTLNPDWTRLIAGGSNGVTRVFDTQTRAEVLTLPRTMYYKFSPDGMRIAGWNTDGVVRFYDARTGMEVFTLQAAQRLSAAVFSPDGARIAATIGDMVVRVYDARTGSETLVLQGSNKLGIPEFSPDGARIAVPSVFGGGDGAVRVYDARTGAETLTLQGTQMLGGPVFSPDGACLAVMPEPIRGDRMVRVYDVRGGAETLAIKGPTPLDTPVFSPDGLRIATGGINGAVRVYDARTGAEVLTLPGMQGRAMPLFSPDGTRIAAVRAKGVQVYDARTGAEILTIPGAPWNIPAYSPDGTRMASEGDDEVVRVYDARTGTLAFTIEGTQKLGAPVFSPDGERIAVGPSRAGEGDEVVRVYDARTRAELFALKGGRSVFAPVFSPDGAHIAVPPSVIGDGVVRVYDARTGAEAFRLQGPQGFGAPVFSRDGERIAVAPALASEYGVVRMYDARRGTEVLSLNWAKGVSSHAPAFSPDGTRIAVAFSGPRGDGAVRVFDAPHDTTAWQAERRKALVAGLPTWHRNQAGESDRAGEWFAAAFHWGQLALAEPASGQPHFRRGLALVNLARTAEAKTEFETALALKKDLGPYHLAEAYARLGQWDKVPDATGLMALARFATHQERRFVATASLFKESFQAHPKWADARVPPQPNGLPFTNRRFAASAAAMAAAGEGDSVRLTDEQRAGWRRQALDWLRAELEVWKQSLDEATPQEAGVIAKLLADVQADGWLASVRDAARLARLPETERDAFRKVWDDVAALLKKAQTKKE